MRVAAALASAFAFASGAAGTAQAQAQRVTPAYYVVEHGKSIKLGNFSSVDPDCHVIGRTAINLIAAPQGGEVEIENGFDYPQFQQNNVRFNCNRRRLAATILYYKAARNFAGVDSFTIEAVATNGYTSQTRYTINVR